MIPPSPRPSPEPRPRPEAVAAWFASLVEHHAAVAAAADESASAVAIAGVSLGLRFAGEGMRTALLPALAHHPPGGAPEFTILLSDGAAAGLSLPPFPWSLRDVGPKGEVAAATAGSVRTAYVVGSHVLSTFDAARKLAVCWTPDAAALPWYERAAPLRTLLHWILTANGRHLVHAAAVAAPGHAEGALLAGAGGSGKSTTAMLCLGAGFRYAGDDYVGVSRGEKSIAAHSLYSTAKLSAASLDWLPFLRSGVQAEPAGAEKGVVTLGDVVPGQLAPSFPVRALLVPRVTGGETSQLRRTSAAQALRALAPTTIFQLPGSGASAFEQLAAVARELPAWSLDLGRDREAIPSLVARAVEESG